MSLVYRLYCVCVCVTHSSVPTLQQRFSVPEQQSVIWVHDVGFGLHLLFFLLRVRLVERLIIVLVKDGALKHKQHRTH